MPEKFTNNGQTTLNGAILSGAVTLVITSAATFPTSGNFRIRIDDEIMLVTSVSGTTLTVSRAQENTSAAGHADLATVRQVLTAGVMANTAPWDGVLLKANDDTVTNSTVYVSDSELTHTVVSGGVYEYEFALIPAGLGNFKFQLIVPSSSEGVITAWSISTGGNIQNNTAKAAAGVLGNFSSITQNPTPFEPVIGRAILYAGGSGTVAIQFAQNATNATGVKLKAGSVLRYRRLV